VVFVSLEYALLLTLSALAFWLLPARFGLGVLLVSSVWFYASWSVPHLALLFAAISVGYLAGRQIDAARSGGGTGLSARAALTLATCSLFGLLGIFKYADFVLDLLGALSQRSFSPVELALPLAISFYVFQVVAYLVDVYRGAPAEGSPLHFAVFVAFFPQLVAGPIARGAQLLPQLAQRARFDPEQVLRGLQLIALGALKKTVVADNLAVVVDRVYARPVDAGGLDIAIATVCFGAQIYCDFSGYTDIARGSGLLFGIELPRNFLSPYISRSATEFWRRWHITLSTWLRDYLYIPLGGNRGTRVRTYLNLFTTMLIGGLWHGASVTFLVWGAYHGLLLALERALGIGRTRQDPGRGYLHTALTFVAIQLGWALFRAGDWDTLLGLGRAVFQDPLGIHPELDTLRFLPLALLFYVAHPLAAAFAPSIEGRRLWARPAFAAPVLAGAIALCTVFGQAGNRFIYFDF